MKPMIFTLSLLAAIGAGSALAANCTTVIGTYEAVTASAVVNFNTVCYPTAAPYQNQEYHNGAASGPLIDWKLGPAPGPDQTSNIGTWTASGTQVGYTYTAGGVFVYNIFGRPAQSGPGTYDFCPILGGGPLQVRVISGQNGC